MSVGDVFMASKDKDDSVARKKAGGKRREDI